MKSLLVKIPGKITINTQEIFANSIQSKYYSPTEFLTSKIPKNCFSFFHLNIASLECHIDDLKSVLSILDFDFDVIGISESRIKNDVPIANLDIPGYKYEHTPTNTSTGGTLIFVKNCFNYEKRLEYCNSVDGIAESVFIDIKFLFRVDGRFQCRSIEI